MRRHHRGHHLPALPVPLSLRGQPELLFLLQGNTAPKAQTGRPRILNASLPGGGQPAHGPSDRVRITAQLIEASSGKQLWSERYDREFKDVFALQDDITQMIVACDRARARQHASAGASKWTDSQAVANSPWGNYQCGLWYLYQFKQRDQRSRRVKHFETGQRCSAQTLRRGPCWSRLCALSGHHQRSQRKTSPRRIRKRAYKAARHRAVELDDQGRHGAHGARPDPVCLRRNYEASIAQLEAAIKLNRNLRGRLQRTRLHLHLQWPAARSHRSVRPGSCASARTTPTSGRSTRSDRGRPHLLWRNTTRR